MRAPLNLVTISESPKNKIYGFARVSKVIFLSHLFRKIRSGQSSFWILLQHQFFTFQKYVPPYKNCILFFFFGWDHFNNLTFDCLNRQVCLFGCICNVQHSGFVLVSFVRVFNRTFYTNCPFTCNATEIIATYSRDITWPCSVSVSAKILTLDGNYKKQGCQVVERT